MLRCGTGGLRDLLYAGKACHVGVIVDAELGGVAAGCGEYVGLADPVTAVQVVDEAPDAGIGFLGVSGSTIPRSSLGRRATALVTR